MAKMAKLERVLGCTACPSSFAIDQTTGMIAYAAGSTVVLITKNNGQFHFVNNSKNNITCITFSSNGKYLATGEFGNCPMVRVWEILRDGTFQGQQIAELKYHTLGVLCVKFTHDSTQLISVGIQHDKSVAVWDWRGQKKIAENRLTSQVNAMDISEDGNCFVTVGVRHVKFWMLNGKEKALSGRSAILAEQRNNTFLDICCASGNRAFALTDTRLLVEFYDKKIVNTFELTGEIPYSITLGPLNHLLIGFSNGHVRAINTETIEVQQLPGIPHYLHHDISTASGHESFYQEGITAVKANQRFPDVKALLYHQKSKTLTVLYSDRSIYQWLLTDSFGQSLLIGYRNHVGAILDLEMVPKNLPWLPAGTFMTSGVDATIRFWSLEKPNENVSSILTSNILSPELKKVLFLSPDEKLLSDHADNHSGMIFSDPLDSTTGARCLKLSPDGRHLAAGFRDGNLGVFDITTDKFEQLISVEAHDGEMLCIEYADPQKTDGHTMLASGGRDRLIHLYDAENGYQHLATVEDHSSSVNSIKFVPISNGYEMFTCATDKLVVIRRVTYDPNSTTGISLERINQFSSPSGLNYLTTSPDGNLIGACQDRQLRTYTINGKMNKQIKGTLCEEGTLTKLALDPSGTYAATVCSDRYVYVIDISTGECAAVLNGQADCVTSIAFTPDCRRLVVVSHSGCVFVWRLSNMLTKRMTTKLGKTETSSSLTTGGAPLNDRCSTPDSLIESGSDSASFIGSSSHKKDHPRAQLNASGSEFGSLTSIQITQDDDLDSGVGGGSAGAAGRQHPPPVVINDSEISLNDSSNFEIRRLPARSTKDLTLEGCEDSSQMLSTHPLPPASYASSRSMSNLHRTNASPQRTRRKWDSPEYTTTTNGHVYQQPIQNPQVHMINNSPNNSGLSTSISLQGLRSHANYDSPLSGPKNSFAPVPQRITPGTYTNTQMPPNSMPQHSGQIHSSSSGYYNEDIFDRANASRNSLTKKFMNLSSGPSSLAGTPNNGDPPKTVWTPQKYENNRRPSNLFNNFSSAPTNSSGIHRRQSEKITSVSVSATNMETPPNSRRLFQRNNSSTNNIATAVATSSPIDSPHSDLSTNPNSIQMRRKPMDRTARRRLTVSAYADTRGGDGGVSTPLSPGFPLNSLQEEDYEDSPLHKRSQSPSSLMLNLESSRAGLRKNSEMGSTMSRITPSSSRSNLRSIGSTTLNKSSQALNKMLEAKEKLKKSQENLALQIGEDAADSSPTSSNSMARSRSIGNLRRTTQDNLNNTFHGFDETGGGLSDNKRQMARSVTSLHNGGGDQDDSFRHPDEYTLQAQYGSNSRRQSSSRLADSIRNLQKLSNPDLTNEHLFEPAETSFGSGGGHNSSGNFTNDPSSSLGAPYYSTTLPKSMRKGAVSKRVYKATAARLDQTSESDSNTSDQTPNGNNGGPPFSGSYIKSAGSGFLRNNNGPLRSSSSVEAGRVATNRRMFDSGGSGFVQQQPQIQQQRKPQNYLAQKINQYDAFVGQDNGIIDESSSPRSMASASFDVPMTDEHSKKMAMHLYECIEQFNTACDKILGARQLIDTDTSLTSNDREKLLKLVNKSISQGRGRLENFEQGTTSIPSSNRTTTLSGGTGSNASMGGPSHLASPSPTPSEPRISIDANFINRYGPQIMHLLQENMSKQN